MAEETNDKMPEMRWEPLKLTFEFERTESGLWFGHCNDLYGLNIATHSLEAALKEAASIIPHLALAVLCNDSKTDMQKTQFRRLYRHAESEQYEIRGSDAAVSAIEGS